MNDRFLSLIFFFTSNSIVSFSKYYRQQTKILTLKLRKTKEQINKKYQ